MTQAANTFDKYDVTGNREDLSDIIFDVSPHETVILSAIKKGSASNTLHQWQVDALSSAGVNAAIEGDDGQDGNAITATSKLNNQTQILKKKITVSGTQEKGMDHAGVRSEMAYQEAREIKVIKLDCEFAILDNGNALGNVKVEGSDTEAREMAPLSGYIKTNVSIPAGASVSSGDGTDLLTAGSSDRDLTEELLTSVLALAWENGGDPTMLAVSAINKGVVSGFTGGSERHIDTSTKELIHTIDVYVGDFHTLKIVPCRQLVGDNVYAIDPNYLKLADLRPLSSYDLAKTGDNHKREMVWETTLEVCNEKAHAMITDTNG
jgi:hypothetical protein